MKTGIVSQRRPRYGVEVSRTRLILSSCRVGANAVEVNTLLLARGIPGIDSRSYKMLVALYRERAQNARWRGNAHRDPDPILKRLLAATFPTAQNTPHARIQRGDIILDGIAKDVPLEIVNRVLADHGIQPVSAKTYNKLEVQFGPLVKDARKRRRLAALIKNPPEPCRAMVDAE